MSKAPGRLASVDDDVGKKKEEFKANDKSREDDTDKKRPKRDEKLVPGSAEKKPEKPLNSPDNPQRHSQKKNKEVVDKAADSRDEKALKKDRGGDTSDDRETKARPKQIKSRDDVAEKKKDSKEPKEAPTKTEKKVEKQHDSNSIKEGKEAEKLKYEKNKEKDADKRLEKKAQKVEKKEKMVDNKNIKASGSGLNIDTLIASKKKYREAVKSAKFEEQMYVKFRVKNLLENHQPEILKKKKKHKLDDSFPRLMKEAANAKLEGTMAFGMRKAHFLSIRPNPRYATWFGKENEVNKNKVKKVQTIKVTREAAKRDENYRPAVEAVEEVRHGVNENCPLDKEGNPFWVDSEDPPDEDDEYFVNVDVMEKVQKGDLSVPEAYPARENYDPDDLIANYDKIKRYFERKNVFFNTIRNVKIPHTNPHIGSTEKPHERKVVFSDKMSMSSYDCARPQKEWELLQVKPFKEIVKKPPDEED